LAGIGESVLPRMLADDLTPVADSERDALTMGLLRRRAYGVSSAVRPS
jgi:hypothetical protein